VSAKLHQLLAESDALLLDFDGPVCSVFAGYPAATVAAELLALVGATGVSTKDVEGELDPIEVLRWAARHGGRSLAATVDDALTAAEVRAVTTASPTPYALDIISFTYSAGVPLAVVSNNSGKCVNTYLAIHGKAAMVRGVEGRSFAQPAKMKPHPAPILAAVADLCMSPDRCVLVGDSTSDMVAAGRAGTKSIGYANRDGKKSALRAAGADVVVDNMKDVLDALQYRRPPSVPVS
jgi:phosphoglycolate phosphatase-like HAD superfamily hydrolase